MGRRSKRLKKKGKKSRKMKRQMGGQAVQASSTFTPKLNINTRTPSPGTFIANVDNWASYITSEESYNAVTLTFNIHNNTHDAIIGLTNLPDYSQPIAWFRIMNGLKYITIIEGSNTYTERSYRLETNFKLVYDGTTIKLFADNTLVNEGTYSGPVYLHLNIGNKDAGVTNLVFAPILNVGKFTPRLKEIAQTPPATFIAKQDGWNSFVTSVESYNAVTLTFNLSSSTNMDIGIGSSSVFHDDSRIAYFRSYNATGFFTVIKRGGLGGLRGCSTATDFILIYDGTTIKMYADSALVNEGTHSGPVHLYVRIANKNGGVRNLVFEPPSSIATTPAPIPGAKTAYNITVSRGINKIDAITFQKNVVTTRGWNTALYSATAITGNKSCYLTFKPGQTNAEFIIGLNDSPPSANPTNLTHSTGIARGFHIYGNGTFDIREGGSIVTTTSTTYSTSDIFGIMYDTINYTYIHKGTSFRITPAKNSNGNLPSQLYLDGSMFHPGTLIQSIYFGALNSCPATS